MDILVHCCERLFQIRPKAEDSIRLIVFLSLLARVAGFAGEGAAVAAGEAGAGAVLGGALGFPVAADAPGEPEGRAGDGEADGDPIQPRRVHLTPPPSRAAGPAGTRRR